MVGVHPVSGFQRHNGVLVDVSMVWKDSSIEATEQGVAVVRVGKERCWDGELRWNGSTRYAQRLTQGQAMNGSGKSRTQWP